MSISDNPKLSVIMVDGSFRERWHVLDFLANQSLPPDQYELLWVEHFDKVRPEIAEQARRLPNCRIITLNRTGEYHSSYCFNAGIGAARGDVVVIIDADVVVEDDFLESIWNCHRDCGELAMYIRRYDQPEPDRAERVDRERLRKQCLLRNPTNYGGCLTVRKRSLLQINGYDLNATFGGGFHANGLDVHVRLRNLGLPIMWHASLRLLHPWHPGTLVHSEAYERQVTIIRYREFGLDYLPFNGIDTTLDREIPAGLASDLAAARGQGRTMVQRVSSFLKRGVE